MIGAKRNQPAGSTIAVAAFMSALWLLGLAALTFVPDGTGSGGDDALAQYRHRATGTTYAQQDATGRFTVYVRGSSRTPYFASTDTEG